MRRLILFDIDGTLVWGGPAKEAFRTAMADTFGTVGAVETHSFAGKTDPQIARELLTGAGFADHEVDRRLPDLWRRYLEELEARLPARPMELLTGVRELLGALEATGQVGLGLVTGNIAAGAWLKLASVGLHRRFRVGGYGSDGEIRNHLPRIAMDRARDAFGVAVSPENVVIVGDTPRDVACGHHEGTRTVAVATGRYDLQQLRQAGPDRAVRDFAATEAVVEALLEA